jgi:hypothetical protein
MIFAGYARASETKLACDGSVIEIGKLRPAGAPAPTDSPSSRIPVPIEIGLQITELGDIDELTSSFQFEGYANFRLCDPRAAFDAVAAGRPMLRFVGTNIEDPVWNVKLHVANGLGATEVTQRLIEIDADGSIRLSGYFNSKVANAYDLQLFPFDRQELTIYIESFTYNNESVVLVSTDEHVSLSDEIYATEWQIGKIRAHVEDAVNPRERTPFSRAVITVDIVREWGFYLFKLWLPLSLIVGLSWSVFWMPNETLASRIRLASTAFLTVVAYQFAVAGSLPKVAYLTLMDRLMIGSFILIALTALQSMSREAFREGEPERALRWDQWCRWLFPLAYVGGIAAMWLVCAA